MNYRAKQGSFFFQYLEEISKFSDIINCLQPCRYPGSIQFHTIHKEVYLDRLSQEQHIFTFSGDINQRDSLHAQCYSDIPTR
jgi:hypothetical protein